MAGTKEFNVDLDVKGTIKASIVPNNTGTVLLKGTGTDLFSTRTNAQFITDLNLALKSELPVYTSSLGISKVGNDFRPTYGTAVNTIAQGNDSRINNGQTAFGWGNHSLAGYALSSQLSGYVPTSRTLTAGNGLSGGGNLTANRTFTLGTPSQIGLSTTNAVTTSSHTHALDATTITAINNGQTAFGWGNHSLAGYIKSVPDSFVTKDNISSSALATTVIDFDATGNGASILYAGASSTNTPNVPGTAGGLLMRGNHASVGEYQLYLARGENDALLYRNQSGVWNRASSREWVNTQLSGYVPTSRTITINGVAQNLSANRAWTIADTITRLRGTATGTFTSGDLTLLAGANTTITQSGANITIASTNTNTTYTAGTGLSLTGTVFANTAPNATHTGDVTGATALTIANSAVTHAKYQNIATQRILGRGATGTGNVQELTLGSNLTLSTAGVLSATNTNTTYSASNGILLTGTNFTPVYGTTANTIAQGNHTHTFASLTGKPTTIQGYGITDAYTKVDTDSSFVPYTGATANVNLGTRSITSTGGFIGNASTATKLASITTTFTGSYPVTVNVNGVIYSHAGLTYTGSTGALEANTFIGALSGNATTATRLATARTINGTSFNGSANIVTANWGTARTVTIGNTGKSVNGSGNVAWSLAEIGASSVSHTHPISDIVGLQTELNKNRNYRTYYNNGLTSSGLLFKDENGNDFSATSTTGRIYDIRLSTTSTGAHTGARYVLYNDGSAWNVEEITPYFTSSFQARLRINSSGLPEIFNNQTNPVYGAIANVTYYHVASGYGAEWKRFISLDYKLLFNTPTIPTVNNGQLTLSTGTGLSGSSTFGANQSTNSTFTVGIASGYVLPTTAQTTSWNNKQNAITGGATTIATSNLTANRALISNASGKVAVSTATSTQLGYLSGVTSAIQTQLNDKINTSLIGANNGVASLGSDGKINSNQLPALAITETFPVSTQAQMLALTAQQGDVAIRSDNNKTFILRQEPASTLANWEEMLMPASGVQTVAMSVPTGFSISGSPITSTGTLALGYASGYQGFTTTQSTKLAGIATGANNYTLPIATATVPGGIELFSNTVQSVASNAVSTTASRTYGIQLNSAGQAVVNVPWSNTNTTYSAGTGISLSGTTFGQTITTSGTGSFVTGVTQTTNGFQINLGTPPNTNTTYSAGSGLTLSGTTFSLPIAVSGSGNYVTDVTQTTNGITVTKSTLPSLSGFVPYTGATQNLNLGTRTITTTGSLVNASNSSRLAINVLSFYSATTSTGILSLKFPIRNASATMFDVIIRLYGYSGIYSAEYRITFYQQSSTAINATSGLTALLSSSGSLPSEEINVGIEGSNICIDLGSATTSWNSHLSLSVDRLESKYTGWNADYHEGWTYSFITDVSNYVVRRSVTPEIVGTQSWVTSQLTSYVPTSRTLTAGNGLSGGGNLTANRTFTLGTPSAITLSSTNSVATSSHTHAFTPGGTTAQYIRGDGSLATYANTTYSAMTASEALTGTSTTARSITAKVLADEISRRGDTLYLPLTGGTLSNSGFGGSLTIHRANSNNSMIGFTATTGTKWYIGMDVVTGEFGVVNSAVGVTTSKAKLNGLTGVITGTSLSLSGTTSQYIRGDGSLATYANTTYTAGTGISLSGTTFGQAITTSGTGTFVTGVTQTTNGFQINLGTPPNTNTTYAVGAIAELNTGTVATGRLWGANVLNQWINGKGFSTQTLTAGTNISISGNVISSTNTNTTYTAGTGLSLTGTVFANTAPNATHTGDVTGSTALTIATSAVTHAKYQNIATQTFLGRVTAGTGNVEALTVAQMKTALGVPSAYTLPQATATVRGGVEIFSNTVQTVAATAVSTTASRTYGIQLNSAGQAVVNVPWTNTIYTAGTVALLQSGTNTSNRVWSPKILHDWFESEQVFEKTSQVGLKVKNWDTVANKPGAIAIGQGASATRINALAMMAGSTADGIWSLALGVNAQALKPRSSTIGPNSLNNAPDSSVLGVGLVNNQYGATVLGNYNLPVTMTPNDNYVDSSPLLIVGNGKDTMFRSNSLVHFRDGSTEWSGRQYYNSITRQEAWFDDDNTLVDVKFLKTNGGGLPSKLPTLNPEEAVGDILENQSYIISIKAGTIVYLTTTGTWGVAENSTTSFNGRFGHTYAIALGSNKVLLRGYYRGYWASSQRGYALVIKGTSATAAIVPVIASTTTNNDVFLGTVMNNTSVLFFNPK